MRSNFPVPETGYAKPSGRVRKVDQTGGLWDNPDSEKMVFLEVVVSRVGVTIFGFNPPPLKRKTI